MDATTVTLQDFPHDLVHDLKQYDQYIIATVAMLGGLILVLAGQRLKKPAFFALGGVGGMVGMDVALYSMGKTFYHDNPAAVLAIDIVVGIIVGVAVMLLEKLALFTLGAVSGVVGGSLLWQLIAGSSGWEWVRNPWMHYGFLVLCGVVAGVVLLKAFDLAMCVATAFSGGYFVVLGLNQWLVLTNTASIPFLAPKVLFGNPDVWVHSKNWQFWAMIAGWVLLAVIGAVVQLRHLRKEKQRAETEGRTVLVRQDIVV